MAEILHRQFFLTGPAGRLEALLWTAPHSQSAARSAVVCHPHPLFGGTMHNKVVYQAAKTLHGLGITVLRFNFRGAGSSEGEHDRGRGELEDVRAAIDWLAAEFPSIPILLAGFSFGAWVGLRAGCDNTRVRELIGLGLPVDDSDFQYLKNCGKPKLFVQGSRDQFGARERLEQVYAAAREPKKLVFVEGADHFFTGKLEEMNRALREWLTGRHPELANERG